MELVVTHRQKQTFEMNEKPFHVRNLVCEPPTRETCMNVRRASSLYMRCLILGTERDAIPACPVIVREGHKDHMLQTAV
eukprot:3994354-Amphidinium_carterae.1